MSLRLALKRIEARTLAEHETRLRAARSLEQLPDELHPYQGGPAQGRARLRRDPAAVLKAQKEGATLEALASRFRCTERTICRLLKRARGGLQ